MGIFYTLLLVLVLKRELSEHANLKFMLRYICLKQDKFEEIEGCTVFQEFKGQI